MDLERGIILAGMIAAVIALVTLPMVFAWGVYVGTKGRAWRRARAEQRRRQPYWWGYKIWR